MLTGLKYEEGVWVGLREDVKVLYWEYWEGKARKGKGMARKAKGKGKQRRQRRGYDMESIGQGKAGKAKGITGKAKGREGQGNEEWG